ncbi:MAG: hypothetical protein KY475_10315 [Planctomycetes bacterium]|nr:hypothetical protein [Planctomycetota bacterium]
MKRRFLIIAAFIAAPILAMASHSIILAQEATPEKPASRTADVEQNDDRARARLAERIQLELLETPFRDVLAFLADSLGVEVYAAWKELEAAGIPADAPITIDLDRIRGSLALELTLDQAGDGLAYVIRDGVVIVSTHEDLEGAATTRVYNCRDLLAMRRSREEGMYGAGYPGMEGAMFGGPAGGSPGGHPAQEPPPPPPVSSPAAGRLVNILTRSVAPSSWQSRSHTGTGAIAEYQGLIVVNHNARVHAQIEQVLAMLRQAAASGRKPGKAGGR